MNVFTSENRVTALGTKRAPQAPHKGFVMEPGVRTPSSNSCSRLALANHGSPSRPQFAHLGNGNIPVPLSHLAQSAATDWP